MTDREAKLKGHFSGAKFDVEHALGMYATGYCTLPAEGIYDEAALTRLAGVAETCHIYLIGLTPRIEFVDASQAGEELRLGFEILGKTHEVVYPAEGLVLKHDGEMPFMESASGQRLWPDDVQLRLSNESGVVTFDVQYVGQAYGKDGSRNAIDRLLKHETLQRIALKGVPAGYRLTLLLLAVQPSNQLFTVLNPFARDSSQGEARIRSGLDKLFGTTELERISLYEASLIRHFYPAFNKEFKDSFPSTNLKILQDCYAKDFSAVIAEIHIDELPFRLCSSEVPPAPYHIAKHDLHREADRRAFFAL